VRGQTNVSKVHTLKCAAYNLGLLPEKSLGLLQAAKRESGGGRFVFRSFGSAVVVAAITDRTMERTLTWLLGGCGLLLVSVAADLCTRFIRSARKMAIL